MSDSYSAAVNEETFQRMRDDDQIRVTDSDPMGERSNFDRHVTFEIRALEQRSE